jgi:hypothetical protein
MGALRLTSRRWALPLRRCADAPYMQRPQGYPVLDTCQSSPSLQLAASTYIRWCRHAEIFAAAAILPVSEVLYPCPVRASQARL